MAKVLIILLLLIISFTLGFITAIAAECLSLLIKEDALKSMPNESTEIFIRNHVNDVLDTLKEYYERS